MESEENEDLRQEEDTQPQTEVINEDVSNVLTTESFVFECALGKIALTSKKYDSYELANLTILFFEEYLDKFNNRKNPSYIG